MDKIVAILLIVNVVLAAAAAALHKLVEAFPSLASADSVAGKVVAAVQKIVDFLSANVAHPAAAPAPQAQVAPAAQDAPKA